MTTDATDAVATDAPSDAPSDAPRASTGDDDARARREDDATGAADFDDATRDRVRAQIEFYLGDSNLPRDAFLLDEVSRAVREGHGGGVPIALIASFSRMRDFLAAYGGKDEAKNVERVARALEGSDVVEACADGTRVRRKSMLVNGETPDLATDDGVMAYRSAMVEELDKRFVFASPFAKDATIEALLAYFKTVGNARSIRLRRHTTSKDFRGSIFVEFATEEEAKAIAERADLEYKGAKLTLMMKAAYMEQKKQEQLEKKAKAREEAIARGEDPDAQPPTTHEPVFVGKVDERGRGGRGGRGGGRGGRGGRGRGDGGGGRGGPDRGGARFGGGGGDSANKPKEDGDKPRFGRPY